MRHPARRLALCTALLLLATAPGLAQRLVAVDPPDRLAGATALGAKVEGLAAGPDLDLGFNDYLQVRAKVPAGAKGTIRIGYGTSVRPGFAPDRVLEVPAAKLRRDGRPHTYRLDLGLVVLWRDTLRDLRVDLPAGGKLEYAEVGDIPNDVLRVNNDLNIFVGDNEHKAEAAADLKRLESKHFVFWWSPMSFVTDKGFDPAVMGRRALRMSEECYQVYCKQVGFREPFENGEAKKRDGHRYKVNITSWYQGTWMGGQNGWTYFNIPGWGLRDEGWGNPVPHEFGHAMQGCQPGFLNGAFWESHANYLTELRNRHYRALLPGYHTRLGRFILDQSCMPQDHFRHIYADFRIHMALDEIAPELGLGPYPSHRLWTDGPKEMTAYAKLASLLPKGKSVKDVACLGLRRFALLDFADGDEIRAALRATPRDRAAYDHATGSYLEACQDKPGWWRVPWGRAPMRYGYMTHELKAAGKSVTAELRGVDVPGSAEDWRWTLIAVGKNGKPRYSPVYAPGKQTFALKPGETRVILFVVATPNVLKPGVQGLHNQFPVDKHPDYLRYPYEVRLTGASPAFAPIAWPKLAGHPHVRGGGWVADTAKVDATAYVGPNAMVLDRAVVRGKARIGDYAMVGGDAVVEGDAVVSDWAVVDERATVRGQARVRDHAVAKGRSAVEGDARCQGYCALSNVTLGGEAIVRGNGTPWDCKVGGHAILDYDYSMTFNVTDGVHFNHVPWGGWFDAYYAQTLRKPRGLIASYRVEEPDGAVCWDEFGALHAVLRGNPKRVPDDTMHRAVLQFDGKTQHLALDRSVCDAGALTVGVWCKPADGPSNQPLLYLGTANGPSLRLTARDLTGRPRLVLRTPGGTEAALAGLDVTPVGQWTHLAIELADGKARLYVNGALAKEGPCSLAPEQMLAPIGWLEAQANYVGRDATGMHYAGQATDIRFYNVALADEEVARELRRRGDLMGAFLPRAVEFVASTPMETGVRNGLVRTLAAFVRPDEAADGPEYQAVLDSRDERDAALTGAGLGIAGGKVRVRLDGVGYWDTGVAVTLGKWQHVALAFDGKSAHLFVDGREVATRTYDAKPGRLAPKCYRIGYTQTGEDPATRVFFRGALREVRVYSRALTGAEVAELASSKE